MAINFPNSPANNQIYFDETSGNRYVFNAVEGVWRFAANTVGVSVSSIPPSGIGEGSMWWNKDTGRMFVYYNDGTSTQWVETTPAPGSIDSGLVASYANAAVVPVFAIANAAFGVANAAYTSSNASFGKANTALQNTTGTFNGTLTTKGNQIITGSTNPYVALNDGISTAYVQVAGNYLDLYSANAITLSAGTTMRLKVDTSGYVTTPYQPAFHAVSGNAATTAGNVIVFPSIITNISNSYNNSTGRFTCPISGTYMFICSYMKDAGNTDTYTSIRRNGTAYATMDCTGSNYTPGVLQAVISCVAGDYVDVYVNGGTVYQGYRQFSGFLIG